MVGAGVSGREASCGLRVTSGRARGATARSRRRRASTSSRWTTTRRYRPATARAMVERFEAEDDLGIVFTRIEDPATGRAYRPGYGTSYIDDEFYTWRFHGCAAMIRRSAIDAAGYYLPEEFFRAAEENDLAVRVLDAGFNILYMPSAVARHKLSPKTRDNGRDSLPYRAQQPRGRVEVLPGDARGGADALAGAAFPGDAASARGTCRPRCHAGADCRSGRGDTPAQAHCQSDHAAYRRADGRRRPWRSPRCARLRSAPPAVRLVDARREAAGEGRRDDLRHSGEARGLAGSHRRLRAARRRSFLREWERTQWLSRRAGRGAAAREAPQDAIALRVQRAVLPGDIPQEPASTRAT